MKATSQKKPSISSPAMSAYIYVCLAKNKIPSEKMVFCVLLNNIIPS